MSSVVCDPSTPCTLAATADGAMRTDPVFTGAPEQRCRIDKLIDGAFRIIPRAPLDSPEPVALTAIGAGTPALIQFSPKSDRAKRNFHKV